MTEIAKYCVTLALLRDPPRADNANGPRKLITTFKHKNFAKTRRYYCLH